MKKYILGAALSLGMLSSPALASAAGLTSAQVQSILSLLSAFGADQSVITNVQTALNGGAPTSGSSSFCYNFNNDLTVGNSGADVSSLNKALTSSGIDTTGNTASFSENTAGDVVSFQAKYGIRQTGYVGPITRAKLNALYGCGSNQQSTQPTQQTTPPPAITLFGSKDQNPTIGSVLISWQTSSIADVSLDMSCTPGSISLIINNGSRLNCDKGGAWNWNGLSSGSILVTPSGNVSAVTVPFTLTVLDQNGAPTNQKQTIYVTFPVTTPSNQTPIATSNNANLNITDLAPRATGAVATVGTAYPGVIGFNASTEILSLMKDRKTSFSIQGLPPGLLPDPYITELDYSNHGYVSFSGTPTQAGTFSVTAMFTDHATFTVSKTFSLTVNPAATQTTSASCTPTVATQAPAATTNSIGTITITSPNGGECLSKDSSQVITWTSSSNIDKVSIAYVSGSGTMGWIANNVPNTGSYSWNVNVGNTTETRYKIEVIGYHTGVGSVTDYSDNYFAIPSTI